ncbi:transcriptional regulator Myc-B-like [Actinia tenebrosa]|uniref:Transcriptional regulator Myc-B-like n=1 Tax=Actinia tenebrosa TaxID=6105 RepID=A0A6P8IY87_ACTTE|nr:transcriptional regulator Myc-B-like [Actinia tenebrosa]
MIPSPRSPASFRRASLISQLDFDDFLNMDKNSEGFVGTCLAQEDIQRSSLNSQLSKSLQIVPDLDELYTTKETLPSLEIQRDFKDLHLSWPKITVSLANESNSNSFNVALSERMDDSVPRSPFLPRTSISEIDNLEILSPLFSVNTSPVIKTPTTLYEICCSSRKSSDDLSIYLPDNFTPASLESLDKSINRSVFQFPATAPKQQTIDDEVFVKGEEIKPSNSCTSICVAKIPESRELNGTADDASEQSSIKHEEKLADNKLIDIALIKEKRAEKKRKHHESRQQREKRQKLLNKLENKTLNSENSSTAESSPVLRNKLERDRRSDLNNRFQKLREIIPDLAGKDKASKVAILKAASDYANELKIKESCLEETLKHEKARNEQLLKNLVNISTNLSDGK